MINLLTTNMREFGYSLHVGEHAFLGDWCFDGITDADKNVGLSFGHYYGQRCEYDVDCKYIENIVELLLEELCFYLNNLNKRSYSNRYWKLLVGEWVNCFVWILFDRWNTVRLVSKYKHNITVNLIDVELARRAFASLGGALWFDHSWNQLLFLDIILYREDLKYFLLPDRRIGGGLSSGQVSSFSKVISRFCKIVGKLINFIKIGIDFFVFGRNAEVVYAGMGLKRKKYFKFMKLKKHSAFYASADYFNSQICAQGQGVRPEFSINGVGKEDSFFIFLCRVIKDYIPRSYIEDFEKYENQALMLGLPISPKVVCTSYMDNNDVWGHYLARCVENGAVYVRLQHGGNYGIEAKSPFVRWELSAVDFFVSWGWGEGENKIIKLGYPHERKKLGVRARLDSIVVVAYGSVKYRNPFNGYLATANYREYLARIVGFFGVMPETMRSSFILKTRDYPTGLKEVDFIQAKFPWLLVDCCSPFIRLLPNARLVIVTYISTAIFEAMHSGCPTIIFLDKSVDVLTDEARPYYECLYRVGVVHYSSESIVQFISGNGPFFDSWWNSDSVSSAVESYLCKFASIVSDDVAGIVSAVAGVKAA